ncbi:MAG: hypothetical protein F6K19_23700 [Cyanothece sp. SIO1E1]|nr:hypothetical protein [Cyanothece sp. SIO1E1]
MANNQSTLSKEAATAAKTPPKAKESEDKNNKTAEDVKPAVANLQDPDELIKPLKELITVLEKRQKVAQEIGDYHTVLQNLVSGELIAGEELERAKQVIQSLSKLVKATMDHQKALAAASEVMPALDKILGVSKQA